MEWSEGEKWSEKKRNLWRPGVFSLFSGMFHLVKASEWEGTCVPCWSEWFGDFSKGVCWPKGTSEWMDVCCVRVLEGELRFWGARGRVLQWNCSIAMTGRGGGFLLFVCEPPLANFLPHWAKESFCFCSRVWSTTHSSCRNAHLGDEWMAGLTTTQGSYWWHHCWASGHSTLSMFQRAIESASTALWVFHRHDAYCLFFSDYSISIHEQNTFLLTLMAQSTIGQFMAFHQYSTAVSN